MQTERVPIGDLAFFDDNPRTLSAEGLDRLSASLRRFGLFVPLVAWRSPDRGLVVVGGNQRLLAIRRMREEGDPEAPAEIPVVVLDCSEEEARTIVLRDNTHDGEWEWGALSTYLADLVATEPDLDLATTGFDSAIFEELIALGSDPLLSATDPDAGSDEQVEQDDGASPSSTRAPIEKPPPATATRFVVGNVRGKISIALYGRLVGVIDARSTALGTNDLGVLFGSLLDDLGGAP